VSAEGALDKHLFFQGALGAYGKTTRCQSSGAGGALFCSLEWREDAKRTGTLDRAPKARSSEIVLAVTMQL